MGNIRWVINDAWRYNFFSDLKRHSFISYVISYNFGMPSVSPRIEEAVELHKRRSFGIMNSVFKTYKNEKLTKTLF